MCLLGVLLVCWVFSWGFRLFGDHLQASFCQILGCFESGGLLESSAGSCWEEEITSARKVQAPLSAQSDVEEWPSRGSKASGEASRLLLIMRTHLLQGPAWVSELMAGTVEGLHAGFHGMTTPSRGRPLKGSISRSTPLCPLWEDVVVRCRGGPSNSFDLGTETR